MSSAILSSRTTFSEFSERSVLSSFLQSCNLDKNARGASDVSKRASHHKRHGHRHGHDSSTPGSSSSYGIWSFLFSITEPQPIVPLSSSLTVPGKLFHFKSSHFEASEKETRLGEGACYLVDKRNLSSVQGGFAVAVKTPKLTSNSPHTEFLILRELQVLTHPPIHLHQNIASILGYSTDIFDPKSQALTLVTELADHGTLKDFLTQSQYEGKEARTFKTKTSLLHDVASGLEALHDFAIVQGDVKIENVLIFSASSEQSGLIAKLSDFGYAIPVDWDKRGEGQIERYKGTTILNAPEVRRRTDISSKDFWKCDVFSYALLVWETIADGSRFYETCTTLKNQVDVLEWLSGLPEDELLRLALEFLQRSIKDLEPSLMNILQRVLKSSLRDNPAKRNLMADIAKKFRRQTNFAMVKR